MPFAPAVKKQEHSASSVTLFAEVERQLLSQIMPRQDVMSRLQCSMRALPRNRLMQMPQINQNMLSSARLYHGADDTVGVDVEGVDITPTDPATLPAEITTSLRANGMQSVEWGLVRDLPGAMHQGIANLGWSIFKHFGLKRGVKPKIIACVEGGDLLNSHLEVNAVLHFLEQYANKASEGNMTMSFDGLIDGYCPEIRLYETATHAYLAVLEEEAIQGRYIYAFERESARSIEQCPAPR
jgi:hypothetical protein